MNGIASEYVLLSVGSIPAACCEIKSITAREMFKKFEEIKEELWGGEFWSDGGYVATVGEGTNADIVRNYIKKQGRKLDQLKLLNFTEA